MKLEDRMYAYVESAGEAEAGKFTNYVLNSRTQNGTLNLRFWNLRNKDSFPKAGDFLEIRFRDLEKARIELEKYRGLSLDSNSNKPYHCDAVPVNEEDVPEDIRKKIKKDRTLQKSTAKQMLTDGSFWNDKRVHEFLLSFVKDHSERFATAPAALGHHHAYKGGLFVHSCEVFCNCLGIARSAMNEFYEPLNTDALLLAAWLHDAGKMDTYYMEGDQPKIDSEKENRIGHPTISDRMFLKAINQYMPGFTDEFIDLVSHCILSHHEKPKWGAVVVPATKEAYILCKADYISSRNKD
jgi:23S rRNA maturation-related 3'-5' exoribonuclease YhaM